MPSFDAALPDAVAWGQMARTAMALLKIARLGHPVLLRRAEPPPDPASPEMRRLAEDMVETMLDANGLGLAAPQVHVPLRVFVVREGEAGGRALFDPVLEPVGEDTEEAWEGCLSIPGLRGLVRRAARVRWRALDADGEAISGEAVGLAARVMQHEADHLDGVVYPMRMHDLSRLGFGEELARAERERDSAAPAAAKGDRS